MIISVYSLIDPETKEVRYIGKTQQRPLDRLYRHVAKAKSGSRSDSSFWIRSLIKKNLRPIVNLLEETDNKLGPEREKYWIALYQMKGARLTNMTIGGYGSIGYKHTEASKAKIKAARAKQVITEEHKLNTSRTMKAIGHKPPDSAEYWTGRSRGPWSDERKKAFGESRKGFKHSEETRRKMSESRKELWKNREANGYVGAGRKKTPVLV